MDMLLKNGDFVPDVRGIPMTCSGVSEILNQVMLCLVSRRGGFTHMPQLGSRLYQLKGGNQERLDTEASMLVREALAELDQVAVREVSTIQTRTSLTIKVKIELEAGNYEIKVGVPLE